MNWIDVWEDKDIPTDKTIIVEDCNGWIGQAYKDGDAWTLETFGQLAFDIDFDTIVRYIILDD